MSDAVIDLGELPAVERESTATGRPRPARTAVGVAVLALAAALGGAARLPPPDPPIVIPARVGDATFESGSEYVVVSGPTARVYRLADGVLLSQTPVPLSGLVVNVRTAGNSLVVSQQTDISGGVATLGLAVGTGRVLWRQQARFIALTAGRGLALVLATGDGVEPMRWSAIEPATGAVVWAQDVSATGATDLAWSGSLDDSTHLLVVSVAGHVEVHDPETGAVTAAADVPAPPEWRTNGIGMGLSDDLVLLGGNTGFTAYDLRTLVPRWSSRLPMVDYYLTPVCGDVLCLFGRFGGVRVLDPATGVQRWAAPDGSGLQRVGDYLLAGEEVGPTNPDQVLTVLDLATGRLHARLGTWRSVGEPGRDGRVFATRLSPTDQRAWYARLDPGAGTVRVLGVAESVAGDCRLLADRLVCRRVDSTVGLWRMPHS